MKNKPLTPTRLRWLEQRKKPRLVEGEPLNYPIPAGNRYASVMVRFIDGMCRETEREVLKAFRSDTAKQSPILTQDASITGMVSRVIRALSKKYLAMDFLNDIEKMLRDTNKASVSEVKSSIEKLSGGLSIKTDFLTGAMKEQVAAYTRENVSLFKTITSNHFATVEKAVIDSIVSGNGMADLVPFFEQHSNGQKNYAKNRALDQTKKSFASLSMERMKNAGVEKVKWMHSHGSNAPRKLHVEYNGCVFRLDTPPYIGTMYGVEIYGFGGVLPYCSCRVSPVFEFEGDLWQVQE
jgi:SPP1 gp7 family putative phage head morphogenesis protein